MSISASRVRRLWGTLIKTCVYYVVLVVAAVLVIDNIPSYLAELMPIGGNNFSLPEFTDSGLVGSEDSARMTPWESRLDFSIALTLSLLGTVLLMIPVTWVYLDAKGDEAIQSFVVTLFTLPICATSIVLLIQDSLALAFGLAALVAAVRFRVRLLEAMDGVYIFAAICVGLASGVGHLGVALVMAVFFNISIITVYLLNYGRR